MWQNIVIEFIGSFRRRRTETDEKRVREILKITWAWNKGNSKVGTKGNRFSETKCKNE